jgi:hypothetical protein
VHPALQTCSRAVQQAFILYAPVFNLWKGDSANTAVAVERNQNIFDPFQQFCIHFGDYRYFAFLDAGPTAFPLSLAQQFSSCRQRCLAG